MGEQDEHWQEVQDVFEGAMRCPPAERRRYVREMCRGIQVLIDEVESLLAAYDPAEEALERPPEIDFGDRNEPE